MNELIVATKNKGKVKEFAEIFSEKGCSVKSLLDFPSIEDIEESGTTFRDNAIIKAEAISKRFNKMVIADDSGLAVDALGGNPGIYSARYAGPEKDDQKNIEKLLKELEGFAFEERTARFHCALAVAIPGKETKVFEGICEGIITDEPKGENGFGYDPIMYIPNLEKTMAELLPTEKNAISHRAKAIQEFQKHIDEII
ncbi:XTP/dITP diphosphatase [Anaerobacillus sp. MEB173]|uniref:XTP/dITP diphosphatase n=1 Tax=Anaerobacillus sp. MEB173 TaxID=3383345 RepID=UPI003F932F9D